MFSCFEIKKSSDYDDMVKNSVDNFSRNYLEFRNDYVNARRFVLQFSERNIQRQIFNFLTDVTPKKILGGGGE